MRSFPEQSAQPNGHKLAITRCVSVNLFYSQHVDTSMLGGTMLGVLLYNHTTFFWVIN